MALPERIGRRKRIVPPEYVNRRGDRYFVHQGTTKTGKPKYYCSRKPEGALVDQLPAGFELYENPQTALVSVRKVRPSGVSAFERESLACSANKLAGTRVIVDIEGDSLVVYASDTDAEASLHALTMLLGELPGGRESQLEWIARHARYGPALRFTLQDEDERLFFAERWCYFGGIDDWVPLIGGAQDLESLANQLLPHVGRESFFDLM
jgi:hypothetical protein